MARKLSPIAAQITLDLNKWTAGVRQFQRDGKAIQASLKPVAELTKNVGAVFAAVGSAVGGSLLLMAKKAADYGDAMLDASQKTGISTKQLSALRLVAQQSGSSFEGITAGATKLSLSLFEAGTKGGDAAKVFTALGISVKDSTGRIREASDVLPQIAERFVTMKDGAEKTAIAVKLFGKAGADMIPVLNNGADGFRRAAEMVEKYNIETADGGKLGDEFNDNLAETAIATQGLANQIGAALLPGMIKFVQIGNNVIAMVSKWAKEHPGLTRAIAATAAMMSGAGGLLLGMSAFARFAPGMIANLKLMSTAFMGLSIPMRAVIIGLTVLTAAFIAFPRIRGPVLDTLQALYKGMALVVSAIVNLGEALGNLTGRALTGDVLGVFGELKKLREIPANITEDVLAAEARFKGFVGGISAGIKDMNAALNMKPANMPDFKGMGVDLDAFGKNAETAANQVEQLWKSLQREAGEAAALETVLARAESHHISASIVLAKFGNTIKDAAAEFRLYGDEMTPMIAKYNALIEAQERLDTIMSETTAKFEKERESLREISEIPIAGGGMTPALEALKTQGEFGLRVKDATDNLKRQQDEVGDLSKQILALNRQNMSARDIEHALGVSIADVTRRAKELGVQIDPLTRKLGEQEEATRNLQEAWGATFAAISDRLVDMVVDFDFSFKRLGDIAKDTAKSLLRSFLDGFLKPFKDGLAKMGEGLANTLSGVLFGGAKGGGGGIFSGLGGVLGGIFGSKGSAGATTAGAGGILGSIFGGGSGGTPPFVPGSGGGAIGGVASSGLSSALGFASIGASLVGPIGQALSKIGGGRDSANEIIKSQNAFQATLDAILKDTALSATNKFKQVANVWEGFQANLGRFSAAGGEGGVTANQAFATVSPLVSQIQTDLIKSGASDGSTGNINAGGNTFNFYVTANDATELVRVIRLNIGGVRDEIIEATDLGEGLITAH